MKTGFCSVLTILFLLSGINAGAQIQYEWTTAGLKGKPKSVIEKTFLGEGPGKRLYNVVKSEFDKNGKKLSSTTTWSLTDANSGTKKVYYYNKKKQLSEIHEYQLADTASRDTIRVVHARDGKSVTVEYRDVKGIVLKTEKHKFDTSGRETELTATAEKKSLVVKYSYNKKGQLTKVTRSKPENPVDGTAKAENETIGYDASGRVNSVVGISSYGLKQVTQTEYQDKDAKGNWKIKIERTESEEIKENKKVPGAAVRVIEREISYY